EYGFESRVREICRRSVELARAVATPGQYVAGSMGPTGEILEPLGPSSPETVRDAFREQAEALAEGGVDLIFIETMMAIEEAELAVRAAKETTGLIIAASMTFEVGARGTRTMWGVDIPTAVERLTNAGADIVGSNCGRGFDDMVRIVQEMRLLTAKPILAQSNAGLPQWDKGKAVYPETPETIRPKVETLVRSRANIIGGCCGTTPEHIRIIREVVNISRVRGK
ncbi:MAG: homocysteine S-methyltransferase family protein, partial [Bacteroidota bacterium]